MDRPAGDCRAEHDLRELLSRVHLAVVHNLRAPVVQRQTDALEPVAGAVRAAEVAHPGVHVERAPAALARVARDRVLQQRGHQARFLRQLAGLHVGGLLNVSRVLRVQFAVLVGVHRKVSLFLGLVRELVAVELNAPLL
eukprot:985640-Pyramimonas_sp.AAC.1